METKKPAIGDQVIYRMKGKSTFDFPAVVTDIMDADGSALMVTLLVSPPHSKTFVTMNVRYADPKKPHHGLSSWHWPEITS